MFPYLKLAYFTVQMSHDILSHFFDGLNYGLSVGKPKNNDFLGKKNTKGVILKQKGTGWLRMEKIAPDWK